MSALDLFEVDRDGGARPTATVQLDHALRDVGACYIRDADLPGSVLAHLERVTADFFRRPLDGKLPLAAQGEGMLGYRPPGSASYAAADGSVPRGRDACELFKIGRSPEHDEPEDWAGQAPEMRAGWRAAYTQLAATAVAVGHALADAAGPADPGVGGWMERHAFNLAVNWYPGGRDEPAAEDAAGRLRGAHTDFGPFTLLHHPAGTGGLEVEVEVDGEWRTVPPMPGNLIILLGDLMAHTTEGRWRAPRHRVTPPPGDPERMSVVFFVFPDPGTEVPAAGGREATTAGRFVAERLERIYA